MNDLHEEEFLTSNNLEKMITNSHDDARQPDDYSHQQLLKTNQQLQQKVFQLHNIYRISLELTSILNREQLHFAYLANIMGLLRTAGAMVLLPDSIDGEHLNIADHRGFAHVEKSRFQIPVHRLKALQVKNKPSVWSLDDSAAQDFLADDHAYAVELGISLLAPFFNFDQPYGAALIGEKLNSEIYTASDFELLSLVNNFFATVIKNANLVEKLETLSTTDELTSLFNRRAFDSYLDTEVKRCKRFDLEFTLIMLDIDHFKRYNDNNGHPAGDRLLHEFAGLLKKCVRASDIIARYGGDEIAFILTGVDVKGATRLCKRLKNEINSYPFEFRETQPLKKVTASMGLASFPLHSQDSHKLVEYADRALYISKTAGRNKFSIYKPKQREV